MVKTWRPGSERRKVAPSATTLSRVGAGTDTVAVVFGGIVTSRTSLPDWNVHALDTRPRSVRVSAFTDVRSPTIWGLMTIFAKPGPAGSGLMPARLRKN